MNIVCISKYAAPPKYSKISARLFHLATEFAKLGNRVTLVTSDSNHLASYPSTNNRYNFEKIDDVTICWVRTKKYKKTASISRIISWIDFELKLFILRTKRLGFEKNRPDIIIVSSLSIFTILYGFYLKKRYKSFLVFEIRDIWPLTMVEEGGFSRWNPLTLLVGWVEKFGYKKSDIIVGTMPRLDKHVNSILGYNKPFFCSPLGFAPEFYKNNINSNNKNLKYCLPNNKIIVGYAGSMGITNNLDIFIDCIFRMKDHEDLYFALVGSGDLREEYEKKLKDCYNVTFLPRLPHDEVMQFLKECDILYLSTMDSKVWKYGQSMNKVVEYMLASKPIVASYSGYPSMINEAGCGYFISNVEDLEEIFVKMASLDPNKLIEMGKKGREWIYKYRQYTVLAKEYIDTIKVIMEESNI